MFGSTFTGGDGDGGGGFQFFGGNGVNTQIVAGGTMHIDPFLDGLRAVGTNLIIPEAGTLKNLYMFTGSPQPLSGTLTATVMVDNLATALVITIPPGGINGQYQNIVNQVAIAAGARVRIEFKNNAAALSSGIGACTFKYEP